MHRFRSRRTLADYTSLGVVNSAVFRIAGSGVCPVCSCVFRRLRYLSGTTLSAWLLDTAIGSQLNRTFPFPRLIGVKNGIAGIDVLPPANRFPRRPYRLYSFRTSVDTPSWAPVSSTVFGIPAGGPCAFFFVWISLS